jgi:hypothetical protein
MLGYAVSSVQSTDPVADDGENSLIAPVNVTGNSQYDAVNSTIEKLLILAVPDPNNT